MIAPFLVPVLSFAAALTAVPECRDDQLQQFVARIEEVQDLEELAVLRKKPSEAVACLIRQLRVVNVTVLRPEDKSRRPDDFRTIWSIRALRYLTGGEDFCAPTAHFNHLDKDRQHFLTLRCGPGSEVSFFGVWMSRDIIYVAPKDAQKAIIRKWIGWYQAEGTQRESYAPVRSLDDWYF